MVYNLFFYDKVPLGCDLNKTPENEAEKIALKTMNIALSDNPGTMSPQDAIENLTKAYNMGFLPALYWCGWLYQYHPYIFLKTWYYGLPGCALMHYRKAENYYLKAIHAGNVNAHYGLATLYIFGNYDNSDRYLDGYPGIDLSKGLYHMYKASINGVAKATEGLSRFFANDIYNSKEELKSYMYGIEVNKYRDQSGLRYDKNGELVFNPDALGFVNFECLVDDELHHHWKECISNKQIIEPQHIVNKMSKAIDRLKKYEEEYIARKKSDLYYDRKNYIKLRCDDHQIKIKQKLYDEMQQKIDNLPKGAHQSEINNIYDEYHRKIKLYHERISEEKMKNAIGITVTKAPEKYDLGASKFFGTPTVPAEWKSKFEDTQMFFCQIRLSDVAELDVENKLPHTGYLYIFLDVNEYPYKAQVLHYDGEPDTALDGFNEEIAAPENRCEAWLMSFSKVEEDAEGIKLLGEPADWPYEETVRLLMQYDPLASDMGFRDSIDGFAYFVYADDSDELEDVTYIEERS